MNRIHQLDTRERTSPQYLEKIPNLIHAKLEVGDYLTVEMRFVSEIAEMLGERGLKERHGHLVENKFEDFDIQSTDTVDQFHKELFQMDQWRLKNPHVVLHAAWVKKGLWKNPYVIKDNGVQINVIKTFMSMCAEYDVWPHFYETGEDLLKFYQKLDQPSAYQKHGIFLMKEHILKEMAAWFRQFPMISSEDADGLSQMSNLQSFGQMFESTLSLEAHADIEAYFGDTVENEAKKVATDLINFLNYGSKRKQQDPPVVFDGGVG